MPSASIFSPRAKRFFKNVRKDCEIWPLATSERSLDPHDIARLDANGNLIAQTRSLELMRKPLLTEWSRFVNLEIGTINRDQAYLVPIITESVFPANLRREWCRYQTVRFPLFGWKNKEQMFDDQPTTCLAASAAMAPRIGHTHSL